MVFQQQKMAFNICMNNNCPKNFLWARGHLLDSQLMVKIGDIHVMWQWLKNNEFIDSLARCLYGTPKMKINDCPYLKSEERAFAYVKLQRTPYCTACVGMAPTTETRE